MSREHNHNPHRRIATSSRTNLPSSRDVEVERSRLDAQLQTLVDNILPNTPYLISVPSDVPYRPNSRVVSNWHLGTPFAQEEEPLQYMSFLSYQGGEQSLIKAVGGWSDGQGNLVNEDPSPEQIYGSSSNSPSSVSQRKKISLNDYKSKARAPEIPTSQDDMGQSGRQQPTRRSSHTNGATKHEADRNGSKVEEPVRKTHELKRSFAEAADDSSRMESPKAEKRARTKSPVRATSPKSPTKKMDGSKARKERLPSLLSPTLPPAQSGVKIPELLSPTLPSWIEDLLALEPALLDPNDTTSRQRSSSVRSVLSNAALDSPLLPVAKKTGVIRSNHERNLSPSLLVDVKEAKSSPGARGRDSTSSPGPRRRRVIVLKYGKRNRKRVEALLKFAPRSKKQVKKMEPLSSDKQVPSKTANGVAKPSAHAREKDGPTSHPSEAPSKRPRGVPLSTLSDRPTTPIAPSFKSSSVPNSLPPRSAFSTPKRELKTSVTRRMESSEGVAALTPSAGMPQPSTPGTSGRLRTPKGPVSPPLTKADLVDHWKQLSTKYFELGRSLKRQTQKVLNEQEQPHGERDYYPLSDVEKQCLPRLVEALLCFMLHQAALEYGESASSTTWRSLLPYLSCVHLLCKRDIRLQGLVAQLGAVCRQKIFKYDMEKFSKLPFPEDPHATGSAPTPGSDGNTKSSEDYVKAKKTWNTLRAQLWENDIELQRAWLEGCQKLGPTIIENDFGDAWDHRAADSATKGCNGKKPSSPDFFLGTRDHAYHLPLDSNTGVVEAVRFALEFLKDWWKQAHEKDEGEGTGERGEHLFLSHIIIE